MVAMMMHETNTFSPVPTPLASFWPLPAKSRQHFRAGFEPIARHIVLRDGEGVTSSDLRLFRYKNRRRPLYPFEES
jgi:microcystin degradation protein MlrC